MAFTSRPSSRRANLVFYFLLLVVAISVGYLLHQNNGDALAREYSPPFRWDYPNVTPVLEARPNFPFPSELCGAAKLDLSNNTDLNFPTCFVRTGDSPGDIQHTWGDYGVQEWDVFADTWWWGGGGALRCFNYPAGTLSGNCNNDARKSTFQYTYWSTNDPPGWDGSLEKHVMRQEIMHGFGMNHYDNCADISVMRHPFCPQGYLTSLTSLDRSDLRNKY